jgi:hypothetical protein
MRRFGPTGRGLPRAQLPSDPERRSRRSPSTAWRTGSSGSTFDEVETDAPELPKLDAAGNLTFHVGGRLRFSGTEDGNFRGDLPITVEYQ